MLLRCQPVQARQSDYTKAQQAYAAGHYGEAADLFARAAAVPDLDRAAEPDDAVLMLSRSLVKAGQLPRAEGVLRSSMLRHPQSAPTFYLLAHVLQMRNKPKESLAAMTDAARLAPPSGEDLRIAALDYVLLDDYADALRWSTQAVAADPTNAEAWYDLARVQMHNGRYGEAIHALQRSLALHPGNARALDNLGLCLENENRNDDAIRAYQAAIHATDTASAPSALPYRDLGKLLVTRNDFAQATPLLLRATRLDAGDASTFAALGSAYVGLHQASAARSAMETAVRLDPRNPRLHYQLARIYRSAGEAALADREFKQSAAMYGNGSAE